MNRPIIQKTEYFRSPKMMASMKHFPCQHCGADDGTIVGAHSNSSRRGKGKGIKSHDIVAALCARCHEDYDTYKGNWSNDPEGTFLAAVYETMRIGFSRGIFVVVKQQEVI
jgi:hypothetical protein